MQTARQRKLRTWIQNQLRTLATGMRRRKQENFCTADNSIARHDAKARDYLRMMVQWAVLRVADPRSGARLCESQQRHNVKQHPCLFALLQQIANLGQQ